MTLVLVHGVPEAAAIWDEMLAQMDRDDVVALSPPGFGAPVPDGYEPTSDGYRDLLVAELEHLDGPVDLEVWRGGVPPVSASNRALLRFQFDPGVAGADNKP